MGGPSQRQSRTVILQSGNESVLADAALGHLSLLWNRWHNMWLSALRTDTAVQSSTDPSSCLWLNHPPYKRINPADMKSGSTKL
eukprot:613279-Alexandrium_andersonii.AAC.1